MQTPRMWRSASLYSSRLQDSPRCCLPDSSLLQKRPRTQTQQQSPSLGIRNSQKEADGEFLNAKAHSRETSACCPMSFNTEQCANSAGLLRKHAKSVCNFVAHSILIRGFPFILPDASWLVEDFVALKGTESRPRTLRSWLSSSLHPSCCCLCLYFLERQDITGQLKRAVSWELTGTLGSNSLTLLMFRASFLC